MSPSPSRDLRRRFNRDPPLTNEPLSSSPALPTLPPLRSLGLSRRELGMSSSPTGLGSRSRSLTARWPGNHRSLTSITSDLVDLDRNLESANSHLQALLDSTVENSSQPYMSTLPPTSADLEHADDSRRAKRRRLDSDKISSNFMAFHYGKYGQVEPGQLKMEIVSCDGGLYSNGLGVGCAASYAVENILKNDASVYCTKGNRCNIVLRHQGATVFSLKELVIKGPGLDYSSPVREGMVFVSMNQDDLLRRTAQYQIQYVRPRRLSQGSSPPVYSVHHAEDGSQSFSGSSARARRRHHRPSWNVEEDDEENFRQAQIPNEFNVEPPPFHVTTECSEDSGTEGPPLVRIRHRRTPNRIGTLPFESDSSDEDAGPWGGSNRHDSGFEGNSEDLASHLRWTSRDRDVASQMLRERGFERANDNGLAEAEEASQAAMQEAVRAVGGSLMAPLAHFYIAKEKNKCTIRFDPPVSGRFILLKMWSPLHDPTANIDIQGVTAMGFAGPRYFPAVEPM